MKTIRTLIELSIEFLSKKGVHSARREAEDLLAFSLGKKRLDLYLDYDSPLESSEIDAFRALIDKKSKRMPFEYIVGSLSFLSLNLQVNSKVLIPRKETEVCLDKILKQHDFSNKKVWDIATGSGCIGLACKARYPESEVTLSDISDGALEVAKGNAEQNQLKVHYKLGDLLAPFKGEKADVVFCNPPYISEQDFEGLEPEVRLFEPKGALVAPNGGLDFYRRLANSLPSQLADNGLVFLEIGFDQGDEVMGLFSSSCWKSVFCMEDLSGRPRFISLEFSQIL